VRGSCIQLPPLSRQYFLAGADICETNTFSGAFFLQATTTLSNADFLYMSYDISFYLSHDALFFYIWATTSLFSQSCGDIFDILTNNDCSCLSNDKFLCLNNDDLKSLSLCLDFYLFRDLGGPGRLRTGISGLWYKLRRWNDFQNFFFITAARDCFSCSVSC
jgi:hypothetical protein